jgi:hypothetical protein
VCYSSAVGRTGAKLLRPVGAADVAAGALISSSSSASAPIPSQPAEPAAQQRDLAVCAVPSAGDVEIGPQLLGVLRRKPGKGDPTLSLSCSDKIARWACLGLQGCLLSSVLQEPLYLSTLVVSVPAAAQAEATGSKQQECQQEAQDSATKGPAKAEPLQEGSAAAAADLCAASCEGAGALCDKQQVTVVQQDLLAAAEAAGRRALSERLASCVSAVQPPFRVVQPQVVAVQAADPGLGLQPGGARSVASGKLVGVLTGHPAGTMLLARLKDYDFVARKVCYSLSVRAQRVLPTTCCLGGCLQ